MSVKHPIIAITGSSGAGTTTVMRSFQHIFRREQLTAQIVEGDSFHAYNRMEMREEMKKQEAAGNRHFSHFGPDANLLGELETVFKTYGETGGGKVRKYYDATPAGRKVLKELQRKIRELTEEVLEDHVPPKRAGSRRATR